MEKGFKPSSSDVETQSTRAVIQPGFLIHRVETGSKDRKAGRIVALADWLPTAWFTDTSKCHLVPTRGRQTNSLS